MTGAGQAVSVERTLTQRDFDDFAALSGDHNPIHVDPEFSARTRFGRTVSHGMLLATILRGLIDELVPGGRQVWQDLQFRAPTYADQPMRFSARVVADEGSEITVQFDCRRIEDHVVTCEGSAGLVRGESRS